MFRITCCPIGKWLPCVIVKFPLNCGCKIILNCAEKGSFKNDVTSCSRCRFSLNICVGTSLKVNVVLLILKGVFAAQLPLPLDPIPTGFLVVYACPSFALSLYSSLSKVSIFSSGLATFTVVELIDCPASACCKSK